MSQDLEEPEEQEAGAPAWVVTFGDMMSLLLTFFVMMLSFSEIDQIKFKGVMGAIKEAFGVQNVQPLINNPRGPNLLVPKGSMDSILDQLNSIIPNAFPAQRRRTGSGEGVILTIPGNVLFQSGEADLKPETLVYLRDIASLLAGKPAVTLQVEGHTDDVPIHTHRFPSNWELSAARSIAVIRFLIGEGIPATRLAATGYADTFPLVPNSNPENREINRRVEFRFIEGQKRSVSSNGSSP